MPGTVICFDCQISGGSTSGVFFTLSGSSSTPTTSPTATGSNTIDSHRGAHGPARGSDFPSKLRSSSSVSTTSRASPPLISFPGGPIANITTTGTSSQSSISSSASASAASSASSNGLSGSKVAAIVLVTGVVAIVTCISLLLWWVSIRRKYRRSWIRIEEAEAKARGRSPEFPRPRSAEEGGASVPSERPDECLAPQTSPARPPSEPTASGTGTALALSLVDGSGEDISQGNAPQAGTTLHDAPNDARDALTLGPDTSSQDDRPGRPQSDTTAFTSAPPPYSQLCE